jgi:outer membrane protein assembly factor BamB
MSSVSIRETLAVIGGLLVVSVVTVVVLANDGGPHTRWRTDLGAPVTAGPALAGSRLIAGTEGNEVVALDATTGDVLWRTPTASPPRGRLDVTAAAIYLRTDDGGVHAVRLEDGAQLWEVAPGRGAGAPVLAGEVLVVATRSGDIVGLDPRTGQELWRTAGGKGIEADPALLGDRVGVGDIGGRLLLLDPRDGRIEEILTLGGDFQGPPLGLGGLVVGAPRSGVVALDTPVGDDDGVERWRTVTGEPTRGAMVSAGDLLIVDASPDLLALNIADGTRVWRYTSRALVVTFGVGDGLAIAGMHTGEVHAVDLATGERVWRYRTNDSVRGTPVVEPETHTAYFGSRDGFVYAVETVAEE